MNYVSVENISKSFGIKQLFENITFGINQGQKIALIAKNGSGKSTLMKCIAGKETVDGGKVTLRNDISVGFLSQEDNFNPENTIFDEIFSVNNPKIKALQKYIQATSEDANDLMDDALAAMEKYQAWDMESQIDEVLSKLQLNDKSKKIQTLSGGQRKRLSLANVLLLEPNLLLLDEPTNHLDLDMIEWLEGYLSKQQITLFMITHDRYFLESVCDEILELYQSEMHRYKGNYSYYLEKKAERELIEKVNVDKAKNLMRKELEWLRRQPKARTTKSKARIDAFDDIKDRASKQIGEDKMEMFVKMERLGAKIIEMHKVSKSFDDIKILNQFTYDFNRKERIGIIGKNGTGKSTFLKLLTQNEQPDAGKIVWGETLKIGYYSQMGMKLKEDKRVIEVIKDIAEYIPLEKGKKMMASQLLERFLFDKDKQYNYVSTLSGGEKRRLYLLTILMENPNFLILDEPTNDLDIYTLNVLEDYLQEFQGCILVVTHDRYFMDKIADNLFVFKGNAEIENFVGNYSKYLEKQKVAESQQQNKIKKEIPVVQQVKEESKKKFGYNEKRLFEQIEKELPLLEIKKQEIEHQISLTSDIQEINKLSLKLSTILTEIEEKTNTWIELADLKEN
jgi:ABC transport system ATP-binding/permease protein